MSAPNPNESWQVEVNGQIYDAKFGDLPNWIAEGSLMPDDKVRRGDLRWIEARKVPVLTSFFNAKANGLPIPAIVVTTTEADPEPILMVSQSDTISSPILPSVIPASPDSRPPNDPDFCSQHPDRPGAFVCLSCAVQSCRECVKSFGTSVTLCSACGGMCKPRTELDNQKRVEDFREASIQKGFGFSDFGEAIAYPLKFKPSLMFGAVMFMFFSIGRLASSFGGIYMLTASIFAYMLANMLAFGILSNTIDSFAHGKIGQNFMPSFDDFALWDDVIHPFFLSIGVYLSSFGPFIAVFLVGSYLVMSSVNSHMDTMKSRLEQTPGTPYYSARDTLDQSNQVKSVLSDSERINQEHLDAQEQIENGQQPVAAQREEEDFQRVNKMIADSKRKELESVVGKSPETRDSESAAFVAGLLKLPAPIAVIGFITFLWGMFYFPAACTIAGYTQSFSETINPTVGLDTIRRLGFDYVKVLLMGIVLLIVFAVVSTILSLMFNVFDMPGVGNLPARALESIVWFYLVIVFACILGFAMFKASDRLRLYN